MRPQWFCFPSDAENTAYCQSLITSSGYALPSDSTIPPIPYDEMWEGDRHWLPLLFTHTYFAGRKDFGLLNGTERLRKWWYGVPKNCNV